MKRKFIKLLCIISIVSMFTGCGNKAIGQSPQTDAEDTIVKSLNIEFDETDKKTNYDLEASTKINLLNKKIEVQGDGVSINNTVATITKPGEYVISGKIDDGQIVVDDNSEEVVHIILKNAEIKSSTSAAIFVKNSKKTIVTLEENTQNILEDGSGYSGDGTNEELPTACFYSKDDITINGKGTLTVKGNDNDGIASEDEFKIVSGTIKIDAKDDGIVGKDLVGIADGNITINSSGDGIKSTNDTDEDKGIIYIENGTYSILSENDALQSEKFLEIKGGEFKIITGGGSVNAKEKVGRDNPPFGMGEKNTQNQSSEDTTEVTSNKGIKSSKSILISGGTFNIDSLDDAVHSNDSIVINGGNFNISAGDDGMHGDTKLIINNGVIDIKESYEGIESANITINNGQVKISSKDDGVNIAGGNDKENINEGAHGDNFSSSSNNTFKMNDGNLVVNAKGDGIDINGSGNLNGGTIIVNGPENDGNGALDYDGEFNVSGGTIIAAGSSGMAQAPSNTSSIQSISMMFSSVQKAGTLINLQNSKGETIATFSPSKSYSSVVISSPQITKGEKYIINIGGISTSSEKNGLYENTGYKNGTKVVEFTTSEGVTWVNESGVTTGGGMGGHGGARPGGKDGGGFKGQRPTMPPSENTLPGENGETPVPPKATTSELKNQ